VIASEFARPVRDEPILGGDSGMSVIAKFEGGQITTSEGRTASWVRPGAPVVAAS
jgi:hypothetical protein